MTDRRPGDEDEEQEESQEDDEPARLPGLFPSPTAPLPGSLRPLAHRVADELLASGVLAWRPGPGAQLGDHLLGELLGEGGQGQVWSAREPGGAPRAIKLLAPGAITDPRLVLRFEREVRLLSAVAHPGLVRVHQVGTAPDGRPWFSMERVPGAQTLQELLRGGLPRERALDLLEEALDALAAVHAAGLVHRDLKPGNVLVGEDGRARLVDFGLARGAGEARLTSTGEVWGTPGYLAPEQLAGDPQRLGPWCDVYAAGAMLHLILAGAPPQGAPGEAPRPALTSDVPPPLAALTLRALQPDPERRPRDAGQLLAQLREARRARPRGVLIPILALLALASLLAAVGALLLRPPPPPHVAPSPTRTPATAPPPRPIDERAAPRLLPAGLLPGPDPDSALNARDGSLLRWVAPGLLRMGSEDGAADERPVHEVSVAGFFMGAHELDQGRYRRFCSLTGRTPPDARIPGEPPFQAQDAHPVFGVTLAEARAYCDWAGLRLPRETEWEWAARGPDGRRFPWGEALPRDGTRVANLADRTARRCAPPDFGACEDDYDDGAFYPTPVGSFPAGASPCGCLDMAGNVWEWTEDLYRPYAGGEDGLQVARGGSWDNPARFCRTTNRGRMAPSSRTTYLGFRVAR